MSSATACMQSFILFCISVSVLFAFDYVPDEVIYRRVKAESPSGFLQIDAKVSVVEPFKFEVTLMRIQAIGEFAKRFDQSPLDTDDDPQDDRYHWWEAKWLRHALAYPLYLMVSDEGFEVSGVDLDERFAHWPRLLKLVKEGWIFDCLFGWDFILQDKQIEEGLLFEQDGQIVCVERVSEDEVHACVDDIAELSWNVHHPLLFQAEQALLHKSGKSLRISIQSQILGK